MLTHIGGDSVGTLGGWRGSAAAGLVTAVAPSVADAVAGLVVVVDADLKKQKMLTSLNKYFDAAAGQQLTSLPFLLKQGLPLPLTNLSYHIRLSSLALKHLFPEAMQSPPPRKGGMIITGLVEVSSSTYWGGRLTATSGRTTGRGGGRGRSRRGRARGGGPGARAPANHQLVRAEEANLPGKKNIYERQLWSNESESGQRQMSSGLSFHPRSTRDDLEAT